jgi:hypothetical protein
MSCLDNSRYTGNWLEAKRECWLGGHTGYASGLTPAEKREGFRLARAARSRGRHMNGADFSAVIYL